jgi:hypothetical protein
MTTTAPHAIDLTTGQEELGSPYAVGTPSVTGVAPATPCTTASGSGTVSFSARCHLQRTGLLLVTTTDNQGSHDNLYVAFTPVCGEDQNGWILGYRYNPSGGGWTAMTAFVTTPYGSGGGIWESGAGLASDGSNIFVSVGNGTYDKGTTPTSIDYGDSVLRLAIGPGGDLSVADYFTPSDVRTYSGDRGLGLCPNDKDVGSGGVLLLPTAFFPGFDHLMIMAD